METSSPSFSFSALPALAVDLVMAALLDDAEACIAFAVALTSSLTERLALQAVLNATALAVQSVPLVLPERVVGQQLRLDLRNQRALAHKTHCFLATCAAVTGFLQLRPAPGFPFVMVADPCAVGGVPAAMVAAAAAAQLPQKLAHYLRHVSEENFTYTCSLADAEPLADERGEGEFEYMDDCPTPHCDWVRRTHLRSASPRRVHLVLRTLLALVRAAGGVTAFCGDARDAWCADVADAAHSATDALLRKITNYAPLLPCGNPSGATVDGCVLLAELGELMRLSHVAATPQQRLSAECFDQLKYVLRCTMLRTIANGLMCPCAGCDALQAQACCELVPLVLLGGPALLHTIAVPFLPVDRSDDSYEVSPLAGAVMVIARACLQHPLKPQLKREGARAFGLIVAALVHLHDAQGQQ
jgi:hypothetical protein